jgi:SM-20-related protein
LVIRDGYLGAAAASRMVARAHALMGRLRPAHLGRERRRDAETRGDELAWLDPEDVEPELWRGFAELQQELNRAAYLGVVRFEVQLARYPGGGERYARHRDAFAGPRSRLATAIYYLNPGWTPADGGQLRVHAPGGSVDVEPLLDRLVLFLSTHLEHEVLPAHAPRLAVTAWYHGRGLLP